MKKLFLFLLVPFIGMQIMHAQNVGIGTLTPAFKLTVQTPKAAGSWALMHTGSVVRVGEYITADGVAEFGTRSPHTGRQ